METSSGDNMSFVGSCGAYADPVCLIRMGPQCLKACLRCHDHCPESVRRNLCGFWKDSKLINPVSAKPQLLSLSSPFHL